MKQTPFAIAAAAIFSVGCAGASPDESTTNGEALGTQGEALEADDGDSLYIGDVADNTVKRFDAKTGASKGTFVASADGPRGLVFAQQHNLLVVDQNVDMPYAGEVFKHDGRTGAFLGALVSHTDTAAPFAPRGIIRWGNSVFVADMGDADYVIGGGTAPNPLPARVAEYDAKTGTSKGDVASAAFAETCAAPDDCVQWSPRGIVVGPDGALYVSAMKFATFQNPNTLEGRVYRIKNGAASVFVDGASCGCDLARPEGLTFGPDGQLYVTSFRKSAADNDKILVFNAQTGAFASQIDLDQVGGDRAFAQALVFGPGGKLYVPISGGGPDTGSVRRYDVSTKTFDVFIAAGGDLVAGWYLTFGNTDAATLNY